MFIKELPLNEQIAVFENNGYIINKDFEIIDGKLYICDDNYEEYIDEGNLTLDDELDDDDIRFINYLRTRNNKEPLKV